MTEEIDALRLEVLASGTCRSPCTLVDIYRCFDLIFRFHLQGRKICPALRKVAAFEVFTAVVMKSTIFWDITPCRRLSVNRRFGGTYCLHIHGRRNKFSKKPASKRLTLNGLHGLTYIPEDGTLERSYTDVARGTAGM
jgi:hypothetical protein